MKRKNGGVEEQGKNVMRTVKPSQVKGGAVRGKIGGGK